MIVAATYFADTPFWIALLNGKDAYHARAEAWRDYVRATAGRVLTTEPVLWELLNGLSARASRRAAAGLYRSCRTDRQITVVDFADDRIEAAVRLYGSCDDKEWSLTDCFSFHLMRERGMTDALTSDHHCEQDGFTALLLRDPPKS